IGRQVEPEIRFLIRRGNPAPADLSPELLLEARLAHDRGHLPDRVPGKPTAPHIVQDDRSALEHARDRRVTNFFEPGAHLFPHSGEDVAKAICVDDIREARRMPAESELLRDADQRLERRATEVPVSVVDLLVEQGRAVARPVTELLGHTAVAVRNDRELRRKWDGPRAPFEEIVRYERRGVEGACDEQDQIGRASCRGRGWVSGGGVRGESKWNRAGKPAGEQSG